MNTTLAKRIYAIVLLVLAGTSLIALISWNSVRSLSAACRRLGEVNLSTVTSIYEVSDLYEAQNALVSRGPAQTDLKALEKMVLEFNQTNQKLTEKLAELKRVDVQGTLGDGLKAFEAYLVTLRDSSAKVFALSSQFQQVEAVNLLQTQVNGLQDKAGAELDKLMKASLASAQVQPGIIVEQAGKANLLIIELCLTVLIVSSIFSVMLVRRKVIRPIQEVADGLAETFRLTQAGLSEIGENSHIVAEGAGEQAASIEETSSSLEEMSSMTKRNAENSHKANELAKGARAAAETGAGHMREMTSAMEAIKSSSDEIAKIIKTIDEISFQTNILSLNAAVEAARAGEAGMGFAVVAEEVRNLAQRCAHSAKETAAKIEGAISNTTNGVAITLKVTQELQEIVAKVRQVDELVSEVASASSEQSQGIDQINSAVSQMDKVTQNNAASAEESASAARQLNAQADALKSSLDQLLILIEGKSKTYAGKTQVTAPRPAAEQTVVPTLKGAGRTHRLKSHASR